MAIKQPYPLPANWPGKKPARHGSILFNILNYFNLAELPKPPDYFRHATPPSWYDYKNSTYGDCVWAGAANETSLWEHEGNNPIPQFTDENVLSDYTACTGFDPKRPATDTGTDMAEAASYRRKTGIVDAKGVRHKIDAFAHIRLGNFELFKSALWFLGGLGLGFRFPDYAMAQFTAHKPWDVEKGMTQGGHYVPAIGINPDGNIVCVSWGREQLMTQRFYMQNADEICGYVDLDRLDRATNLTPEQFNRDRLTHDLELVASGRVYALADPTYNWA